MLYCCFGANYRELWLRKAFTHWDLIRIKVSFSIFLTGGSVFKLRHTIFSLALSLSSIGCFTCCMESGLRIYNVEPLVEKAHFDNDFMGSISMAEMLWRTNVIAVVGGGNRAKFADNTVLIYDDLSKKFVMEVTFTSLIKAVRLRRDK